MVQVLPSRDWSCLPSPAWLSSSFYVHRLSLPHPLTDPPLIILLLNIDPHASRVLRAASYSLLPGCRLLTMAALALLPPPSPIFLIYVVLSGLDGAGDSLLRT